jgi:ribosomal protein S18 acetylase RimI-like enzyme
LPSKSRRKPEAQRLAEEAEKILTRGHSAADEAEFQRAMWELSLSLKPASEEEVRQRREELAIVPIGYCQADAILRVYAGCEDFLSLGPQPKATMEMVMKDLEDSRKHGRNFCGIYDGRRGMVGVIDFARRGHEGRRDRAFIALLMIAGPHRGRGIGMRALRGVEQEIMKDPEIAWIGTGVQVYNAPAIAFWKKMGYETCGGPELMPDTTTVYHLRKKIGQTGAADGACDH